MTDHYAEAVNRNGRQTTEEERARFRPGGFATPTNLLDELDQLRAVATPGPWIADGHEIYQAIPGLPDISGDWIGETCRIESDPLHATSDTDAALIVAAVNAVPRLTAAVRAALALADELDSYVSARVYPQCGTYDDGLNRAHAADAADLRTALTALTAALEATP